MESHLPHQSRVLKLQPNCCVECVRKVKRAMLKAEGVHSIKINASEGTIEVKSQLDPQVLLAMAAKAGKRAELLWEPQPESSENISTATPPPSRSPPPPPSPPSPPPAAAQTTDIASQRQVQVRNFNGFDQTVQLQDLVVKNARLIKHMEIIDRRVTKITFKESHGDPREDHSPSPITPPSSDSKDSGGGEASGSGGRGEVEVVAAPPPPPPVSEPPFIIPPEINGAPSNNKLTQPPVANVNCSNGGYGCCVM